VTAARSNGSSLCETPEALDRPWSEFTHTGGRAEAGVGTAAAANVSTKDLKTSHR
jgi:hypothetical protein